MFRTQTNVHSEAAAKAQREAGRASALRVVAMVQVAMQLLLWITFDGYDSAVQSVWQTALGLIVPIAVLWLIYRKAAVHRYMMLALLPCLLLDAAVILHTFGGLMDELLPEYPYGTGAWVLAAMAYLSLLLSRPNGVAYGTSALKWVLLLCFLLSTVFLRASNRADRLWPILSQNGAWRASLTGMGAIWGVALFRALPGEGKLSPGPVLIPWAIGVIWALWYGFLHPWEPGDALGIGEKMIGLSSHAGSVVNYQLSGLMWLTAQPVALVGCALSGELLLTRAVPKCPRWIAGAILLFPAFFLARAAFLPHLLPFRAAVSLFAGVGLLILGRKEEHR